MDHRKSFANHIHEMLDICNTHDDSPDELPTVLVSCSECSHSLGEIVLNRETADVIVAAGYRTISNDAGTKRFDVCPKCYARNHRK
jgi:hypothetical protein